MSEPPSVVPTGSHAVRMTDDGWLGSSWICCKQFHCSVLLQHHCDVVDAVVSEAVVRQSLRAFCHS